ncbi:glycosyl hydrolase [Lentilactobacillus fungorum]|uniref:Glycosyl hydrolase n=1 Tax=Lentilactobacillus fungorum TaxID=2201250 RepID=A0ABQ3W6L0_9LACO|nr:glycoside hydrolase family 3 C-terminal domain-containing protein [Lentilactobacillus fungorum]GHP14934.1 glycosyl hydrolase [Lentilactobacillus fungorum]
MMTNNISEIVNQLTLKEKAGLVSGKLYWFTEAIKRLGISQVMMTDGPSGLRKQADSSDALGLNNSVEAISFPTAALTASSFDRRLLSNLGKHLGIAAKANDVGVVLGPGVNIKRSPLAGRNFEYFSEDPLVAGELGTAYVKGVQSQGIGVSVKHFAANNRENQRFTVSSEIDERTLREIYLAAFERIVKKASPATLMCSYNAINGTLNSQNKRLLTDILRNEWGFDGLVMSDWGAVADHVAALKAGLDLEMPGKGQESIDEIVEAVQNGRLSESELNITCRRILSLVNRYSELNDDGKISYQKSEQHHFAREAAEESMVLLKNQDDILPLSSQEKLAIIGELAVKPRYQGGGSSHVNAFQITTPWEIGKKLYPEASYAQGYSLDNSEFSDKLIDQAVEAAKAANKVIIFAGVPESAESEGFDKTTIELPAAQNKLIRAITQINSNVVVVLQNGSAVTTPWISQVRAVLETYLAGEAVGEATWDVLTGEVNPSGKLAETFPMRIQDTPTYGTFNANLLYENYREGIYVGYRYYDFKEIPVQFPFGFGLSYTTFSYQNLKVEQLPNQRVAISLDVRNTGKRVGKEIVQLYVANHASQIEKPAKELREFAKIQLAPGESKRIRMTLSRRDFSWYNEQTHAWQMDNGVYEVLIGKSSQNIELSQLLTLQWNKLVKEKISGNTYFSDIIKRQDLTSSLKESGLDKLINSLENSNSNAQLLENIPLRSAVMLGATTAQVNKFIRMANN